MNLIEILKSVGGLGELPVVVLSSLTVHELTQELCLRNNGKKGEWDVTQEELVNEYLKRSAK